MKTQEWLDQHAWEAEIMEEALNHKAGPVSCGRMIGPYACCSVVEGDCLELMKAISDSGVDAVITDPPYGTKVTSWDESIDAAVVGKCLSLARGYSVFFYGNTRLWHLLGLIKQNEHDAWVGVWHKSNSMGFERHFAPQWTPIVVAYKNRAIKFWGQDFYHCPITLQNVKHPTPKQVPVVGWCVERATKEGETVIDPFCGSGTTLVAAKKLGRHFLGFEISREYCEVARDRLLRLEAQPSLFDPPKYQQLLLI
jgi:DNA modification methylase